MSPPPPPPDARRCCGPYELLTDYSGALDATHAIPPVGEDGRPTLSYLQRTRLADFKNFIAVPPPLPYCCPYPSPYRTLRSPPPRRPLPPPH